MRRIWKKTVRDGLRGQAVEDLHDYLDVHRNLEPFLERLRIMVVSGRYRPMPPELITLEKGDGISRRLLLPWPGDALLLQTLVEVIEPEIKTQQPTKNAYYSRSHNGPRIEHVDGTFAYPWWILWPEFQQRIWKFTEACSHVVVTDVASYFDSIPLGSLRNTLASMGRFREPLLDFLFFMLEAFTWRPHYMPLSGVGLPQIDFDAPRLLAHAYLFVVDEELARSTCDKVVRWMDDIDFGVNSVPEARRVLGRLEMLLNSYGLRLNTSKTEILDSEEAARHFWIQENRALTVLSNVFDTEVKSRTPNEEIIKEVRRALHDRWADFRELDHIGQYNKVLGRYFTIFGKLRDTVLEQEVPSVLRAAPKLREGVLRYLLTLGYSPERLSMLEDFLREGHCVDDATVFHIAKAIVAWRVPADSITMTRLRDLANSLPTDCEGVDMAFVAGLWLMTKYGSAPELSQYLNAHRQTWERSEWFARQVAAATPRLTQSARQAVIHTLTASGLREGLNVAAHLGQLGMLSALDEQLQSYLLHPSHWLYGYPLAKVLVALALLDGNLPDHKKADLQESLLNVVDDEVYRALIAANPSAPALSVRPVPAQARKTMA